MYCEMTDNDNMNNVCNTIVRLFLKFFKTANNCNVTLTCIKVLQFGHCLLFVSSHLLDFVSSKALWRICFPYLISSSNLRLASPDSYSSHNFPNISGNKKHILKCKFVYTYAIHHCYWVVTLSPMWSQFTWALKRATAVNLRLDIETFSQY